MIRLIFGLLLLSNLLLFTSCQKDGVTEIPDDADTTGIWIVTHKFVNSVDTFFGSTPFTVKAGYFYDTLTRTVIYDDTVKFEGQAQKIYHTVYHYDDNGRVEMIDREGGGQSPFEVVLMYDDEGLLQKVQAGIDITFTWTRQGTDLIGHSQAPVGPGGPYSFGNEIFTLDADRRFKRRVAISVDTAYGDSYEDVIRESEGGVSVEKIYSVKNGVAEKDIDSIVYTREHNRPPRLSRFYELLGNGMAWYSNGYGISYIDPPSYFSSYFNFEHSLCNKAAYYGTYSDVNGVLQYGKYVEYDFVTEYDGNDNPVKQTIYLNGEKSHEISYRWEKITWLN